MSEVDRYVQSVLEAQVRTIAEVVQYAHDCTLHGVTVIRDQHGILRSVYPDPDVPRGELHERTVHHTDTAGQP